jgi:hypothetical protein
VIDAEKSAMFTDMHLVLYILSVLTVSLNGKHAPKNARYVLIRLDSFIQGSVHNAMGISWMLDYKTMPLGDLIRRIVDGGDQDAAAEFERRWGIPFEQMGTANIQREGE